MQAIATIPVYPTWQHDITKNITAVPIKSFFFPFLRYSLINRNTSGNNAMIRLLGRLPSLNSTLRPVGIKNHKMPAMAPNTGLFFLSPAMFQVIAPMR